MNLLGRPGLPLLLGVFCLGAVAHVRAQGLLVEPHLSIGSDLQLGLRSGVHGLRTGPGFFEAYLDFDSRILPYPVRERQSPTLSHQYRETRWSLGPGVAYSIPLNDDGFLNEWHVVTGAGAAYSQAEYRGTAREARSLWTGWGETGLRYDGGGEYYWGAAVQVKPTPALFPVRALIQMGWKF